MEEGGGRRKDCYWTRVCLKNNSNREPRTNMFSYVSDVPVKTWGARAMIGQFYLCLTDLCIRDRFLLAVKTVGRRGGEGRAGGSPVPLPAPQKFLGHIELFMLNANCIAFNVEP